MSLSADEIRIAALAMTVAYAAMAGGAFIPSWRRRKAEAAPVRGARHISPVVERLWVGTQGVVMLGLLVALVAPQLYLASPFTLLGGATPATAAIGTALFVAGCALIAAAAVHLGAELTVAIETREGGRLVTSGPYAHVRHPIYTGVLVLLAGICVALASPVLGAWGVAAFYCANVRARAEEDLLGSDPVHGEAYRAYLARTRRFLPLGVGRLRRSSGGRNN